MPISTFVRPALLQALAAASAGAQAIATDSPAHQSPSAPATVAPRPAEPPRRPAYQSLRFEERWPAAADPLKHIDLTPGGALHVTLGGQLRARGERVTHFQSEAGAGRSDVYAGTRALLSADLWWATHARIFVEGRDAIGHDRDLPGGRRTNDHDRWDLQNAFVEARVSRARTSAAARAGRQELLIGRERLVGPSDWGNARRAYDGARVTVTRGATALDVFAVRPVVVRSLAGNVADTHATFRGLTLGGASRRVRAWQGYLLVLEQDSTRFAGHTGAHRRATLGARAELALPAPAGVALAWEGEGAAQRGTLGDARVSAWFAVSELTARLPKASWAPSLAAGVDVASGDDDPADHRARTFHQLFPSAHTHGGYADVVGRQNARELRLVATASPVAPLSLRAAAHRFDRMRRADAAYAKSGAAIRSGATDARDLGAELDLTATWQFGRHLRLLAGYAHFAPGRWFRETAGGAHAVDWGFAGTTFTF